MVDQPRDILDAARDEVFTDLVLRHLEGTLTEPQAEQLRRYLQEDEDCRRAFVLTCYESRLLAEVAATERVQGSGFRVQKQTTPTLRRSRSVGYKFRAQGSGPRDQNKTSPMASPRAVGVALAAALITLALTVWFALPDFSNPQSEIRNPKSEIRNPQSFASVATLTDTNTAQFAGAAQPMRLGGQLSAGPIRLTSGSAQIMFASTAMVDLHGPCEFEMTGPNRGRLTSGSLKADVPEAAKGFTVDLPNDVEVVDLGTSFDLYVTPDRQVALHVEQGKVRLQGRAIKPRILGAGEYCLINPLGRVDHAHPRRVRRMLRLGPLVDDPALALWLELDATPSDQKSSEDSSTPQAITGPGEVEAMTLALWIHLDQDQEPAKILTLLSSDDFFARGVALQLKDGRRPTFSIGYGGASKHIDRIREDQPLPVGRWHHLAATLEPDTRRMKLYINGQPAGSASLDAPINPTLAAMTVGAYNPPPHREPTRVFGGSMADLMILSRAAKPEEIARWFKQTHPRPAHADVATGSEDTSPNPALRKDETP